MTRYDFLLEGREYDSIHPSLQRQATLNMNFGLYEIVPDFIYQVRGFDVANDLSPSALEQSTDQPWSRAR